MNKYCDHCGERHPDYRVTYWADWKIPKYSTVRGEQYGAYLCMFCMVDLEEQKKRGEVWDIIRRTLND